VFSVPQLGQRFICCKVVSGEAGLEKVNVDTGTGFSLLNPMAAKIHAIQATKGIIAPIM
jgi:hypothetical protein